MKLKDYLNIENYFGDDFITLLRMESLFKKLETQNEQFSFCSLNLNFDLSNIDKTKKILLSSNPDLDFPRPFNKLIQEYNTSQYNIDAQNYLDNLPYENKIEKTQLDNIPENIKHLFCHSVGKLHHKVSMVPIGRDFKNIQFFSTVDKLKKNDKHILCYYNCTLPPKNTYHWYGLIRQYIYNITTNKSFIHKKKCDIHPRTYSYEEIYSYYIDLSKSKFMICPRGCGIDTYRMWDCIHMGCIPIVEKYEGYQQFDDLPVLYIKSYEEINDFTANFLEEKWLEMLDKDYNYDKLRLSYWENKILSSV